MINTYQDLKDRLIINPKAVGQKIQENIVYQQSNFKKQGAVIGLSGGLDSAVVTALSVKVLGIENIKVLLLPDSESNRTHFCDALNFAKKLEINWEVIDITPLLKDLKIRKFGFLSSIPLLNNFKSFLYQKAHRYYHKISGETPFASQLKGLGEKPYHDYIQKGQAILHAKHRLRMVSKTTYHRKRLVN